MKFKKVLSFLLVGLVSTTLIGCFSTEKSEEKVDIKSESVEEKEEEKLKVENEINEMIDKMSVEEKIGQMLMVDFRSWNGSNFTKMNDEVAKIISDFNLGGVILFAENIVDVEQTTMLCNDIQVSRGENNKSLFIGIDQEGGIVTRLGMGTNLPGNMAIGAINSQGVAYEYGEILASELDSLGINTNFAPSLDVNSNPSNPVIGLRAISSDPKLVSKLGIEMVKGMSDKNVIAGTKHFPGHGDTHIDSHVGMPLVDKSREELDKVEFLPFKENIKEIDMIMTAHIQYPQIEKDKKGNIYLPATLSDDIVTGVLREDMGFDGVVITDAMNMGAIADNFGEVESIKMAINAGVDIVLMPTIIRSSSDIYKLENIVNGVKESVDSGEISLEKIDSSVRRILTLKSEKGILKINNDGLDKKIDNAKKVVASQEHRKLEREISAKAVTVLQNDDVLPVKLEGEENILLVAPEQSKISSMKFAIDRLIKEKKIPNINIQTYSYKNEGGISAALKQKLDNADQIIVLTQAYNTFNMSKGHYLRSLPSSILEYSKKTDKSPIFASIANPYNVGIYKDAPAQLLCYGSSGMDPTEALSGNLNSYAPNIPAIIDVIFGGYKAEGRLPVDVPKVNDDGSMDLDVLEFKVGDGIDIYK